MPGTFHPARSLPGLPSSLHDPVHLCRQFLQIVRLRHHAPETVTGAVGHDRVVGVAAGDDCPDVRIQFPQSLYRLFSPMPPGMVRSMITTSNGLPAVMAAAYTSSTSSPFRAHSTSYPRCSSISPATMRTNSSSSMTSTLPLPGRGSSVSGCGGRGADGAAGR